MTVTFDQGQSLALERAPQDIGTLALNTRTNIWPFPHRSSDTKADSLSDRQSYSEDPN
jgi:hypothetical protein